MVVVSAAVRRGYVAFVNDAALYVYRHVNGYRCDVVVVTRGKIVSRAAFEKLADDIIPATDWCRLHGAKEDPYSSSSPIESSRSSFSR